MIVEPKKFDFIDALRGLAILAVIMVHAGQSVPAVNSAFNVIAGAGARGVQLFYVASALTLCLSWRARAGHEQSPLRNFYLRRLFRIVPMFYVAMAGYLLLYGMEPRYWAPNGLRWYYIPLTALFVNGFHPETLTSVVPGGWSIAVEMTFYLVLPLLLRFTRTLRSLLIAAALSLVAGRLAGSLAYAVYGPHYPPSQLYLVDALAVLNFFSQLPVFMFGLLAFWLVQHRGDAMRGVRIASAIFIAWLIGMRVFADLPLSRVLTMPVAMGALFAIGAVLLERRPTALLVNRLTTSVGKVSYSMYLIHFAIIDALAALNAGQLFARFGNAGAVAHYTVVVAVTFAVARISEAVIERPAIRAGRRMIDRLEDMVRSKSANHDHQAQRRSAPIAGSAQR